MAATKAYRPNCKSLTSFGTMVFVALQQCWAMGESKVKLLFNFLDQDSDGGYQIYDNSRDEDVDVIEPMLFIQQQIDETTQVNAQFVWDTWSAASDTKLDGQTGASGAGIDRQSRVGGQLGVVRDHKSWKWSSRLGASSEYDYRSLNFGGSLETHHADDNFVLTWSPQLYLDQAKNFDLINNVTTEFQGRFIGSLDVSASQLLSLNDVIQGGYTVIVMNGMLNHIANSVVVRDNPYNNPYSRVSERLPSDRLRHAFSTKWVHAYTAELAQHLSYRYYTDDWGIHGHTAEFGPRLSWWDDEAFAMLTYRYHKQDKADFYQQEFASSRELMTSDSDLAAFESHRYGVHYSQLLGDKSFYGLEFKDWELSSGVHYYQRSNNLKYYILQFGIQTVF